jgi:uncharacterized membrane protein
MTKGMIESIEIDATADEVYAVALDIADYPNWADAVKSVDVTSVDENDEPKTATFTLDAFVKEITYSLVYDNVRPRTISWQVEPGGDVKQMNGSYTFVENLGKTTVTYALVAEPNFRVPGFILRQGQRQIIQTALRGLKKQVEQ